MRLPPEQRAEWFTIGAHDLCALAQRLMRRRHRTEPARSGWALAATAEPVPVVLRAAGTGIAINRALADTLAYRPRWEGLCRPPPASRSRSGG